MQPTYCTEIVKTLVKKVLQFKLKQLKFYSSKFTLYTICPCNMYVLYVCTQLCIYVHNYVCTYVCMYVCVVYACICIRICMFSYVVYVCICICMCIYVCTCMCMHVCRHMCMHVRMQVHGQVCVYVCTYVFWLCTVCSMCVYIPQHFHTSDQRFCICYISDVALTLGCATTFKLCKNFSMECDITSHQNVVYCQTHNVMSQLYIGLQSLNFVQLVKVETVNPQLLNSLYL